MRKDTQKQILTLVQFSILIAIEAIICFTPLGSIPIGPLVATLAMIPVIITAVTLGTKMGTLMGFVAGIFSLIYWTFVNPNPLAFVFTPAVEPGNFWSLVICVVTRTLAGLLAGLTYSNIKLKNEKVSYGLAGFVCSIANTVLVLGGIVIFFGQSYAAANNVTYSTLLGMLGITILTNGILEAVIGVIVAYSVGIPINKYMIKK